ncbi:MAG: TIGR03619 family F420-dependent LLM class oxidoreductase [Acidimicrobiales bacterium]
MTEVDKPFSVGVMIFATDQTMPMQRLAPEVEARGFESLWVTEKTHLPVSRATPWPGGELPEWYKRTCDPFVALAAAAAATTELRLGTGVALLALRDPVIAAKTVATLDWISAGRVELGVGYGWNREECATHGVELDTARLRLIDQLELMRTLWVEDEGSYDGDFCSVEPSWSWPKPAQRPGPPIHLGTRATAQVFDDIARWADGWLPIEGYGDVLGQLPALRAAFEQHDRDPDEAQVSVYSSIGDPSLVDEYRRAGVRRVVVWLPPAEESLVMEALDAHAAKLAAHLA